jgi:hypothetical protein
MVLAVSKRLFNNSLYPTYNDFQEYAAKYLEENDNDFFSTLSKQKWDAYYHKNIRRQVSEKIKNVIQFIKYSIIFNFI